MIRAATQLTRPLGVYTPLGDDTLLLTQVRGQEQLSGLFQFELSAVSYYQDIEPGDILGNNVTFRIDRAKNLTRYFNGHVNEVSIVGRNEKFLSFRISIVPWLWFLTQSSDCKIFQNKSVPEIIECVFASFGYVDFELTGLKRDYAKREYCVQYRESHFQFVSRLMEEEGIFYYFKHDNGRHVLTLADNPTAYFELENKQLRFPQPSVTDEHWERLLQWDRNHNFRPGRWAQTDYDFKKPSFELDSHESALLAEQSAKEFELFDYPGLYVDKNNGNTLARIRAEQLETGQVSIDAQTNYKTMTPGGTFVIDENYANPQEEGQSFLVTKTKYFAAINDSYYAGELNGKETEFDCRFTCIPADQVFRPELITEKPVVEGPQTAVVTGPANEEIYTDEHARVKVHFFWDRHNNEDENSSCWLRVSQEHAGKGWGTIDIPRIGEEVIVSFLDGDPDRPIIKGRVYNAHKMLPFGLDGSGNAGNKTRTGGTTNTHKGSGYNEMSMDDATDNQQLRINAQKDMTTNVNNDQTLTVGNDRSEDIVNDDTTNILNNLSVTVDNDQTIMVGNNQETVVGNDIEIAAGTSITLACGASTIHMNQAGVITISGQFVTKAAKATNSIIAPMTEVAGSKMLMQAGLVALDLGGVNHNKGDQIDLSGATVDIEGGLTLLQGGVLKLGEVGAGTAVLQSGGGGDSSNASPDTGGSTSSTTSDEGSNSQGEGEGDGTGVGGSESTNDDEHSKENDGSAGDNQDASLQDENNQEQQDEQEGQDNQEDASEPSDAPTPSGVPMPPEERERLQGEFDEWYQREKNEGLGWTDGLPDCPEQLDCEQPQDQFPRPTPPGMECSNPDPGDWTDPSDPNAFGNYHPGAEYGIRTNTPANTPGNQCTYDENGQLIRDGAGAGTADKSSPGGINNLGNNLFSENGHHAQDVDPYELALALDGGTPGENVKKYLEVRPTQQGIDEHRASQNEGE